VGSGIATITATVKYHGATASTTFAVDVAPLQITSNPSAVFQVGKAGSFTVTTTSSPTATLQVSGKLPAGITFTDNGDGTATFAGTAPTKVGTYPVTITAKNGVSKTVKQIVLLYVGTLPSINSPSDAQFIVGNANTFTVTTTGFPQATITQSGALPDGLSFADNGDGTATITGSASAGSNGSYALTLTASNGLTPVATQKVTLTVLNAAPTATAAVVIGTVNQQLHYGTYTYSAPVAGITVHLVKEGSTTDVVPAVTSATNGSYEFDNVAPGSYQVEFVDPANKLVTQWYNGTATGASAQAGASVVTATAAKSTVGINATLVAGPLQG
jgi:hypothetical protein